MTRNFLTIEEVVNIHDDQIAQFGGSLGLRDMGALESALMRPQMGYYDGLIQEAAAMLESLAMNHPFGRWQQEGCILRHRYLCATERPLHRLRQQAGLRVLHGAIRDAFIPGSPSCRPGLEEHVKPLPGMA